MAELLVLSKLDYCNYCLYGSLLAYLLKRLQKVQNSAAGFVNGRCSKAGDVVSIGWLPIKERIDYSIAKLAFQALDETWPGYLPLEVKEVTRVLRSNSDGTLRLKHSYIEGTFQYNAAKVFNNIPDDFKCMDFMNFKISLKKLLLERSKERLN